MVLPATQALSSAPPPTFTPFLEPPPGVTSNPEHPESLASLADITIGICLPLITIFFFARCYVRLLLKRSWILEDYLVTTAWAGSVGYCAVMRATMAHHGGEHGWDMSAAEARDAIYWFNIAAVEYGFIIGITKAALLMLYRRVFSPTRRGAFDVTLLALMAVILGFYVSNTLVKIFECEPRRKAWDGAVPGRCVDLVAVLNISGGFNAVSDFVILLLPVHAVWKLQMSPSRRVLVILAFTFGLCGPIFATVGFIVRLRQSGDPDVTWNQSVFLLWAAAELATGILCVCFPEINFMFRRRNRRGSRARRQPSGSQVQRGWDEQPVIKKPSAPYLVGRRSLMSTVFSTTGDERDYLELRERRDGYNAQVAPRNHEGRGWGPGEDVIVLESEVNVEHGDRRV
ncbi:hypothetical protein KVR01_008111 [Diaporthe batatas]|uniref:uncharacterized protein n=1 Tax=Diaporthe batatas TaxID=748121 RepID=UPI001D039A89|nr:uncharacterized protein KVR01_008111 [Diaporthe batatas]KAG8162346.1 hypothetical protein KVR01_008111 [Diaporthe batatas]